MISICKNCVFNIDDFCERTYRTDLDEIIECQDKSRKFSLSFYYDTPSGEYRVVSFLEDGGDIINQVAIPQEQVVEMLLREKDKIDNSIINKIKKNEI